MVKIEIAFNVDSYTPLGYRVYYRSLGSGLGYTLYPITFFTSPAVLENLPSGYYEGYIVGECEPGHFTSKVYWQQTLQTTTSTTSTTTTSSTTSTTTTTTEPVCVDIFDIQASGEYGDILPYFTIAETEYTVAAEGTLNISGTLTDPTGLELLVYSSDIPSFITLTQYNSGGSRVFELDVNPGVSDVGTYFILLAGTNGFTTVYQSVIVEVT